LKLNISEAYFAARTESDVKLTLFPVGEAWPVHITVFVAAITSTDWHDSK